MKYSGIKLRRLALYGLIVTIPAVVISYWFVDREVAYWVSEHNLNPWHVLWWVSKCPALFYLGAAPALLWCVWAWTRRNWYYWERLVFAASCGVMITTFIKNILKWVFGRTWPATWTHNNPSLLKDQVYGFFPFHSGTAYSSFPSGHTVIMATVAAILWYALPKLRVLYVVATFMVGAALVGLNHHFVSDVIAGAYVGVLAGATCAYWFELNTNPH